MVLAEVLWQEPSGRNGHRRQTPAPARSLPEGAEGHPWAATAWGRAPDSCGLAT